MTFTKEDDMDQDHQERIRQRAHEIWESEGRPEGRDSDHWSQAEQELRDQSDSGGESGSYGIQSGDSAQTNQSQPELAQPTKSPTAKASKAAKKPRKPAAKADSAPYLHEGP